LRDLKHNVVRLAKAAQALNLPTVVATTAAGSIWGPLVPELWEALPEGQQVIDRSTVNAWHDERVRDAVKAIGRRKLIIAGISLEVCAVLPPIARRGLRPHVAVNASGTFWETKRDAGC
jgi:hypothetical protein